MKYKITSNCHLDFFLFNERISLSKYRIEQLRASKQAIEKSIRNHFKEHFKLPMPKFYIQGSHKMKTLIAKKDGTYDVDLGVFFMKDPGFSSKTLQKHVYEAVKNQTFSGAQHRDKCIRVIYQSDYNIDIPVYSQRKDEEHPFLCTKSDYFESDPKELCSWFEDHRKHYGNQLCRVVKYLKYWAGRSSGKMPSGIALTVWVTENFVRHKRDDVSFYETIQAIRDSFGWRIKCINPATPFDDLVAKLSKQQLNAFSDKLDKLIELSEEAINAQSHSRALQLWRRALKWR